MNTDSSPQDVPATRETKLLLLAVDPYQIHVYWEAVRSQLDSAMTEAGEGARAVLRFYDLAKTAGWFDVEIQSESKNWYVHLWSPGKSYYAELGVRNMERQFVGIVQSNVVHLPRAWPVVAVEERFARVETPTAPPLEEPSLKQSAPEETAPTDKVSCSGGLQTADSATGCEIVDGLQTAATDQKTPLPEKPIDSAELLQRKLSELYAFSKWQPESPKSEEAAAVIQPQKETAIDLTAEAENAFTRFPSSSS